MPWRRRLSLIVLAVLLVGALVYGFLPRPVPVDVRAVAAGPMEVTVTEEGRTRVIDRYVVSAPVAGYVRRVALKVGDAVASGQTLATLEPLRSAVLDPRSRAEAEARVTAAEAALRGREESAVAARSAADLAAKENRRKQALCDDGCVSQEERDIAKAEALRRAAELRSAEFAVEVARAELAAARTALEYSAAGADADHQTVTVSAPVGGRVLKVERESEGVVAEGAPLLELGDPGALEIIVDVLSADAVRIHPGTRVRIDRWGGDATLDGVVRTVEPAGFTKVSALGVEEQRVWVVVDITSPAGVWTRLGDGYRIEAGFVLWQADEVLQVPASALFRDGDAWAVYAVVDGHARVMPVGIGHRNALMAEVLGGLEAGAEVIVHPSEAVTPGTAVAPR